MTTDKEQALPTTLPTALIRIDSQAAEIARLNDLINNPHTDDFLEAVRLEAAHQQERWALGHDDEKSAADWFWLVGFLAGKAIRPLEENKMLHRIITVGAVALNWHRWAVTR